MKRTGATALMLCGFLCSTSACWKKGPDFYAVWGNSPDNIWVVGGKTVVHYSDGQWKDESPPDPNPDTIFRSIYAAGEDPEKIKLISSYGEHGNDGDLFEWNGKSWGPAVPKPGLFMARRAVWKDGKDTWMVGRCGCAICGAHSGLTLFSFENLDNANCDGNASLPPGPEKFNYASAIWGANENDLWFAAYYGYGNRITNYGRISHWDSQSQSAKLAATTEKPIYAIWGDQAGTIWAAGGDGTVYRFSNGKLSGEEKVASYDLNAIWGSKTDDIWAVGNSGTIVRYNGMTWSPVRFPDAGPVLPNLRGVYGFETTHVWIVGDGGTFLRKEDLSIP